MEKTGVKTRARTEVPLLNELAAVYIGCGLTSPEADPQFKAALEEYLPRLESVDVVYKQNTADELNVVVPDFPQYDVEIQRLSEQQMEQVVGGEIIGGIIGILGGIGVMLIGASGVTAIGGAGAVGGVVLFGTAIGVTAAAVAAGTAAVGLAAATVVGVAAVAGAAVGLGIAAGAGAFSGGGGPSPVNFTLAS